MIVIFFQATFTIVVAVTNVNDEAPVFEKNFNEFNVYEVRVW